MQNFDHSNIMIIDHHDKYFIICMENTIIFNEKTKISSFLPLFKNSNNLSICFLNGSKVFMEQLLTFKYDEIKYDAYFRDEINIFNQKMIISRENRQLNLKIWETIKSAISGYLIKYSYQKSISNKLNNFNYKNKNENSSINILKKDEYIKLGAISWTSSSDVDLFFYIEQKELIVMKKFKQNDEEYSKLKERELKNYKEILLSHPFLPKFYGITNEDNLLAIEFINGESLFNIDKINLTENDRFTIIFELMIVIQFIHSKNHVYRDLKPSNVLIDSNKRAILIDFDRLVRFDDSDKTDHTSNFQIIFSAPEIQKGKYSYSSDIYSLGKMIIYIMTNKIHNQNEIVQLKHQELNEIVQRCLNDNEKERPTISQLIFDFYINFHSFILIENLFNKFNEQFEQCFDEKTIKTMKNYSLNENDPEVQFQIGCIYNNEKYFLYDSRKAFYYFKLAAEQNHSQAQCYVGTFYYNRRGVEMNVNQAIKYYELSANQDNVEALVHLGTLYRKGNGIVNDFTKAKHYFELAAKLNSPEAFDSLGNMYNFGEGVEKNYQKAAEYYELAAKQNNDDAIFTLGYYYYSGRVFDVNYVKAKELYEIGAKKNYGKSLNGLGVLHIKGLGVKYDIEKGIYYFNKAVEENNQNAMINLGNIYSYGRGVEQDVKTGIKYYEKAAELGNSSVYNLIGNLFYEGVGYHQDYLEAMKYYKKAAELNNADGFNILGYMYENGKGVDVDFTKAIEYYEEAVKMNQPNAFHNLGNMYLKGKGVDKNYSQAKYLFKRSSKLGIARSSYLLGNLYFNGDHEHPPNYSKAKKYYEKASNEKYGPAICMLGDLYYKGLGVEQNYDIAIKYFEKADKEENELAQDRLGNIYYNGEGVEKDDKKAVIYFENAAKKSNADAIYRLGYYYYVGQVYEQNYTKAKELYEKAAEQNYGPAFNGLGILYLKGHGVPYDIEKAVNYFQQADAENNQDAMINLGDIYSYGKGVEKDFKKGRLYYDKAAKLNYSSAYNCIGNLYFHGVGVDQDYLKAMKYYEKAAELNNAEGFNILGYIYENGKGVDVDFTKAIEYYKKAVKLNQPNACNNLGNIYFYGNSVKKDYSQAKHLFKRSSKLGNARGSYLLGNLYFNGDHEHQPNYSKAIKYYEKASKEKFGPAICMLGDLYYKGIGVEQNYDIAIEYYKQAAKYRNNNANFQIGIIYYYGRGAKQSYEKAKEYFIKSAKENNLNAFYYLGQIYEYGKGTEIDIEKSNEYYKRCAEKQKEIISIDYNQGTTQYVIHNEKYYPSINQIGLLYLFKFNNRNLAESYFTKVGYENFAFGKNNFGFFNLFYMPNGDQYLKMFDSASQNKFTISEFQLGHMKEKEKKEAESIKHYHRVLEYENFKIEIDDEQLYASNIFIYCLTNLKLFLYYLLNPSKDIDQECFLTNAIFRSLFVLLLYRNNLSYSFKFIIDIKDNNNIKVQNLKDFFFYFPWDGKINHTEKTTNGWKIIRNNSKSKSITINIEIHRQNENNSIILNNDSNYTNFEEQIKNIFKGLNENRNNEYKLIEITDTSKVKVCFLNKKQNDYQEKNSFLREYKIKLGEIKGIHQNQKFEEVEEIMYNVNNDIYKAKKCVITSFYDDYERYVVIPKYFGELIIPCIKEMKETIEDIVNEMTKLLYTAPYHILFGRFGENDQTNKTNIKKCINSIFKDGFGLDI